MIKRILKLKYKVLFALIVYIVFYFITSMHDEKEMQYFLENKTRLSKIEYDIVYQKTKEQSEIIFHEKINTPNIISIFQSAKDGDLQKKALIRQKLYEELEPSYKRLTKLVNLKQVHFHLPNNKSFLRMHRVDKFGDDLSDIRETVNYVNTYKKRIDGFEEGRVYNGFRFVYPLFDNINNYIGSVEVSFSTSSIQSALSSDIRFAQFLLSKEIINAKVWRENLNQHYTRSAISPHYLLESTWMNDKFAKKKKGIMRNITPNIKKTFEKNAKKEIAYSTIVHVEDKDLVISFLPIKNPVSNNLSAYLAIITESSYSIYLSNELLLIRLFAFALLLSYIITIYRQSKHNAIINEQQIILLEQSKMAQMGSMLSNIAHQWKQPLARINSKIIEIPLFLNLSNEEEKTLNKNLEDIENLTSYMADTIENFRTYFHEEKETNDFCINDTIEKAITLLDLSDEDITLEFDQSNQVKCNSYEDELIQVLMVLIINAKEALLEKKNPNSTPFIKIILFKEESYITIKVIDNAGGIDKDIVNQIFNPYFSTKNRSNDNNGIGLYMAKMIIELSMKGKLIYEKEANESHFSIIIKDKEDMYE